MTKIYLPIQFCQAYDQTYWYVTLTGCNTNGIIARQTHDDYHAFFGDAKNFITGLVSKKSNSLAERSEPT